tara:strand:+ start:147 stop:1217 length:1071 start_codon:yes stop_codon:yes gene_type:complete
MHQAQGFFYDGQSSKPQQVQISLVERKDLIEFALIDGETTSWALADLMCENIGSVFEMSHGAHQFQKITTEDADFVEAVKLLRSQNGYDNWYQKMLDAGSVFHVFLAILVLAFSIVTYMYVVPWIAEKLVTIVPDSYDKSLGTGVFKEYVRYQTIDSAKTEAIGEFVSQLELNNEFDFTFTVINSDQVNAFALPDGNIVIFSGIIDKLENYEELVALVGHEVAHINNRHSMKMMSRNLAGYMFISLIFSDVNGVMAIITENAHSLHSLSFSRHFEQEADTDGLNMLIANGIDPDGMSDLMKRLESNYGEMIPEFLSSHPVTSQRKEYIEKMISKKSVKIIHRPQLEEIFEKIKGDY